MKNRLLFGLGGAVVGGAFALFIYTGGAALLNKSNFC